MNNLVNKGIKTGAPHFRTLGGILSIPTPLPSSNSSISLPTFDSGRIVWYYANIFLLLHIVSLLHIDSLSIIFFIIVHLPHDTMIYTNLVRILLFSACCMYLLTVYYYNFLNDENKLNIEHSETET